MQYDVFISYSRKDSVEVNSLIDRLRREIPEIKIWYDIEGIESADAFRRKIISAIDECNLVLFSCSDQSLESDFCEKEIMYAKNIGKTVIPYILPGTRLKGWLLFEFGNLNCIDSTKDDQVERLINDLKRWTQNHDNLVNDSPVNPSVTIPKETLNSSKSIESDQVFDPATGEFKQKANEDDKANKLDEEDNAIESKTDSALTFINGHEYVDLGLPSGLKWATCNVGAKKPEEYGDYFDWGAIVPRLSYNVMDCQTFQKDTKWLAAYGFIGSNGHLTLSHDAAHQKWGASWRMPTQEEMRELIENTTGQWVKVNDVIGCLIKSKHNNKSIFLPAAGYKSCEVWVVKFGTHGSYWSSSLFEDDSQKAHNLIFTSSSFEMYQKERFRISEGNRNFAFPIRPVSD